MMSRSIKVVLSICVCSAVPLIVDYFTNWSKVLPGNLIFVRRDNGEVLRFDLKKKKKNFYLMVKNKEFLKIVN